jgi:hypothetical protein
MTRLGVDADDLVLNPWGLAAELLLDWVLLITSASCSSAFETCCCC